MKKIVLGLLAILVLVVLSSGCTSQNNPSNQSSGNVTLQIISNTSWFGDYGYKDGNQLVNGTGNAVYNIGANPGTVTVSIENNGTGNTTVQLLQNGVVVKSQSTENNGEASISHKF